MIIVFGSCMIWAFVLGFASAWALQPAGVTDNLFALWRELPGWRHEANADFVRLAPHDLAIGFEPIKLDSQLERIGRTDQATQTQSRARC